MASALCYAFACSGGGKKDQPATQFEAGRKIQPPSIKVVMDRT